MGTLIGRDYNGHAVAFQADGQPVEKDTVIKASLGEGEALLTAGGLTAVTAITCSTTTPLTGGVTLANQSLSKGACWRIRSFGTVVSVSNSSARSLTITPYFGSTGLTPLATVILASTVQTTTWEAEFVITASSATAAWTTGKLQQHTVTAVASAELVALTSLTAASTTGISAGPLTIDLRFGTPTNDESDVINVHSVTIERIA